MLCCLYVILYTSSSLFPLVLACHYLPFESTLHVDFFSFFLREQDHLELWAGVGGIEIQLGLLHVTLRAQSRAEASQSWNKNLRGILLQV